MDKEIVLTPEQLFFMGRLLQAKYIDYAYVAAMDDVGQNYPLFEKETGAALTARGILEEDFAGNVEINADVSELLKPIFFGEIETSVDVCELGEKGKVSTCKFHFYDDVITMVCGEEGKLLIQSVDQIGIQGQLTSLIPEDYRFMPQVATEIPKEAITRFFSFKSVIVGRSAQVKTYIEASGLLYREKSEEQMETIQREAFISEAYDVIKGA